ncbi:DEKNAAC103250 [Brettanomyces naardenensis]|uniref:DEKNAAC103250 n=1 Tax=Brettanomyces naardenensis TaxID=13370 RepID=A0A448YMR3_BRENA|nr:DEKNAAC103250 [Brettanomyces naardenensis]
MQEVSRPTFFDSFYTLNRFMNTQNPFYISSVFKKRVSIQEDLDFDSVNEKSSTLNLFIRLNGVWQLLCQYHVKLSLLVNIGDNLEEIHEHLKDQANFLIIRLADGCYYALPDTNLSPYWILTLQEQHKQNVLNRISTLYHSRQRTCSYDQIMKLDNLSTCIRDLLVIKKDLEDRIHEALQSGMHTATEPQMKESSARNAHIKRMADAQRFRKFQLTRSIEHNRALQDAKQNTIRSLKSLPESMQERDQFGPIKDDLADHIVKLDQVNVGLNLEKSRIAKDLLFIFPIESTGIRKSSSKYNFQLFGYKFPSTSSMSQLVKLLNKLSRTQMARLNALIGYMVLILIKLSGYLRIPLRFPARFLGSNSYIHDPISHILTRNRLYPLFVTQNSTLILRFSYGLILLTKDLNQLFEYENLYKVDDFNLLVNFKIFLTCLTSYDGRSDNIRDLISESAVSDDVGTSFKPGSPSQIMRDSINETLKSEERTNHIRKHLLEQSDYK